VGRRPAYRAGRRPKHPSSFRRFLVANGITSADENRRFRRIDREGLFSGPNGIQAALFPDRAGPVGLLRLALFFAGPAFNMRGKWEEEKGFRWTLERGF